MKAANIPSNLLHRLIVGEQKSPAYAVQTLADHDFTNLPCVQITYNRVHAGILSIDMRQTSYGLKQRRKKSDAPVRYVKLPGTASI